MPQEILLDNLKLHDINPLFCGAEKCDPGHAFGPAIREYYLLHYVITGTGVLTKANATYAVRAGQIFVIRPGETTLYKASQTDPWEYAWVCFACSGQFAALLEEDVITLPSALVNFQKMAGCKDKPAREWYVCTQLYDFFAKLQSASRKAPVQAYSYVRQALSYIESNYSQPMRVSGIAQALGLSRSYFCRIFKAHTGTSPQEYIVAFKLDKAATYMKEHGLTPSEAARQVGYPDLFSFSRMFSRKFGIPPSHYTTQKDT